MQLLAVLLFLLQIALVVAGILFLCRRGILLRGYHLPRPWTAYIGLILIIQLPITFLGSFAFGMAEGVKSARANAPPDIKKLEKKAQYLNLGIVGASVVLAAAAAVKGIRPYEQVYLPPETVVGVRNYEADKERDEREGMVERVRTSTLRRL